MKFVITLIFTITLSQAFSQKQIVWFDAGLKVQYGAAGFYNKAIADASSYDYKISKGYSFGGKLGVNFGFSGLAIDIMRSSAKQEFDNLNTKKLTSINWTSTDIYALYRNAQNLGYFEIGPKLSLISKVEDNTEGVKVERTDGYNSNNIAGVVGFGANIMGNDGRFSGILGLRFEYAFTDFVVEGSPLNTPLRDNTIFTKGYKPSNVAFAGVVFEINWGIGYFGKAQCGKRSKFIMF
ncbi:MAG: hypothetical protein IPL55_23645 [Saprospiraceae bacterium]|jgi:hypothetical protein|nr:hypothetical protein [Saprospiraceae bacterium]MBL0025426.1 hypothetical protein [Saprospiraceae bacterium]